MTGVAGMPQGPNNLQGAGYRAWQATAGMPLNVAWLGQETARSTYSLLAPLVEVATGVATRTLSTIGLAGISLIWLIPEETYEAINFATLGEFDALIE